MSCWVLPTVAAELWGVPTERVMEQIRTGAVSWKMDEGSLVVDVAPLASRPGNEQAAPPAAPARRRRRIRTFRPGSLQPAAENLTTVSDAELSVLVGGAIGEATPPEPRAASADAPLPAISPLPGATVDEAEMGPAGDPDPDRDGTYPDEGPPLHWQQTRARVARTRRPPGSHATGLTCATSP